MNLNHYRIISHHVKALIKWFSFIMSSIQFFFFSLLTRSSVFLACWIQMYLIRWWNGSHICICWKRLFHSGYEDYVRERARARSFCFFIFIRLLFPVFFSSFIFFHFQWLYRRFLLNFCLHWFAGAVMSDVVCCIFLFLLPDSHTDPIVCNLQRNCNASNSLRNNWIRISHHNWMSYIRYRYYKYKLQFGWNENNENETEKEKSNRMRKNPFSMGIKHWLTCI